MLTTPSPKKACIFCNAPLIHLQHIKRVVENYDLLIAADGGAHHMSAIGYIPQVIVGDMDSIDVDTWIGKHDVAYVRYPVNKDKTDAELAVEYALEQGCEQILLVAATGGRLDHTLGNIALVAHYPGRVALLENNATLVAVDRSKKCLLHGRVGTLVSLVPYHAGTLRVRTKGLKYPLHDECLKASTQGLSNALVQTEACVCVSEGILLVYIENQSFPARDA